MPVKLAIGADHRRGVVIQACRAALKQRSDDHDPQFTRELAEGFGGGSGNRFGQREQFGIFFAAEILGAEQLRQTDDLRA